MLGTTATPKNKRIITTATPFFRRLFLLTFFSP
jgi:hypothetical protein